MLSRAREPCAIGTSRLRPSALVKTILQGGRLQRGRSVRLKIVCERLIEYCFRQLQAGNTMKSILAPPEMPVYIINTTGPELVRGNLDRSAQETVGGVVVQ